jgi:CheY-like chemotaxis protein
MTRVLLFDESETVRRIATRTLQKAGYEVTSVGDSREALEQAQRHVPDLVVADRSSSQQTPDFCETMRSVANLRHTPLVLMSARGDRIADTEVHRLHAADAIRKPFGPEALVAVTEHALKQSGQQTLAPVYTPAASNEAGADTEGERNRAVREMSERLADFLLPALRDFAPGATADRISLRQILEQQTEADWFFSLARELQRLAPGTHGELSFQGRLEHVGLGDMLQMLQHQSQTGLLEVDHEGRGIVICLRQGMVDMALAQHQEREFMLGRYFLEEELVDREDLDMLLRNRRGGNRLLGSQLVKLGYITQEDLHQALVRQTSELVYEALRWPHGQIRFERQADRPEAKDARLGLPISSILMEGLRRVDEWRLIEEQIHSFDQVLIPDLEALAATGTSRMSREERVVLEAVDGERSVREIVEATAMGSFEVCKILFQLMTSRLVKQRPAEV